MKVSNIHDATTWFEVLHTTARSQTAMMTLPPGDSSGPDPEAHDKSDQVLLLLQGTLEGEIGDDRVTLGQGDFVTIPAGTKHRFTNNSDVPAVTFNVYALPAYPRGTTAYR